MGGTLKTLAVADVVEINRRMISQFGGFFAGDDNFSNAGSLEYVLASFQGPIFGEELYPSLFEKAAALGWHIIVGHVFHDGNKRTGMEACRLFLELNGFSLRIDFEIVDMAVQIAIRQVKLSDFAEWVRERSEPIPD